MSDEQPDQPDQPRGDQHPDPEANVTPTDPVDPDATPADQLGPAQGDAHDELSDREPALEAAESMTGSAAAATALKDVAAQPGSPKPDPILIADNVTRNFGGLRAVHVEHLEVQRGTITALIGPNGAGKSTFFNLVTGFDKPNTGTWSFNGQPLAQKSAYRIARMGMVRTFQLTKALMRLTTLENVMLGATGQRGERFLPAIFKPSWAGQETANTVRADELLHRFKLTHMRDEFAGIMSGGQRKLLEMARAMMVEPEMILLDEPMAGVNPALTQSLLGHIQALRDEGTTIVLVEHDMDVIMAISDWIVCFAEGEVIAEGRPEDIRSNRAVIDAYLGARRALPTADEPKTAADTEPAAQQETP